MTTIKTSPITARSMTLLELVEAYVPKVPAGSIVAMSSKVVSLCEGAVVPAESVSRIELARREADYFLEPGQLPHGYTLTIKDDLLVASAGVDASNGNGDFVVWPREVQASANHLRVHLSDREGTPVGVIITDSRSVPLRRGSLGVGLAHSGFEALRNYAGVPDVFGRPLKVACANLLDGLAAAAAVVMGEGPEQTPLVVIEDAPVMLQARDPTPQELRELHLAVEDDLFAEMLLRIPWTKRP